MALPDSKRLSRVTSFRKGWTERISEDGSRIYVHNATGDKVCLPHHFNVYDIC